MDRIYPDVYDYEGEEEDFDEYDFEGPEDDELRRRHRRRLRRKREELIAYSSLMTGLVAGLIAYLIIKSKSKQ